VWDLYQEFGVQLDAPRHFFLHSRASFELLVRQAGLKLESRWCDSNGFQFWGSELYRRGLPLNDKNGEQVDPSVHFSKRQLAGFEHEAERLNAIDRGDQLVAILSQTSEVKA
jgi:hypothetical protein